MNLWLIVMFSCVQSPPKHPQTDAARLVQDYHLARIPIVRLRSEANVETFTKEGRVSGLVRILAERPFGLRVEVVNREFGVIASLTSQKEQLQLLDLRNNVVESGAPCAAALERWLGLPLLPEEAILTLFGESPTLDSTSSEVEWKDGRYHVHFQSETISQELVFELREADQEKEPQDQRLRLRQVHVAETHGVAWSVRFDDYRFLEDPKSEASPKEGIVMPFRVKFVQRMQTGETTETTLRFSGIELNPDLVVDAFVEPIRPGMEERPSACDAADRE